MALTKVTFSMIEGEYINVLDYGAVGDGLVDCTSAITSALVIGKPIYFPVGIYKVTSQLAIPSGASFFGDDSEDYGEAAQQVKNPSVILFSGFSAGTYGMQFANGVRGVTFKSIGFNGSDWVCNGLQGVNNNRELTFVDVSFQKFKDCVNMNDAWVSVFDRVSFTCIGTAVTWVKGTTIEFRNVRLQGDKDTSTPMERGFYINSRTGGLGDFTNTSVSGFAQVIKKVFEISGSVQLDIKDFLVEQMYKIDPSTNGVVFDIYNTYRTKLIVDNSFFNLLPQGDNDFMWLDGNIEDPTRISIRQISGNSAAFDTPAASNWTTARFIKDNGAYFEYGLIIDIDEEIYQTVEEGIDDAVLTSVSITQQASWKFPQTIIVKNGDVLTYADILTVAQSVNRVDMRGGTTSYTMRGYNALNPGCIVKITTYTPLGNPAAEPQVAYLFVRNFTGDEYANLSTIYGTVDITIDNTAHTVTFNGPNANQVFFVSPF